MSYILVVAGSESDRKAMVECLKHCEHSLMVVCASDAFEARQCIAEEDPALIVLDLDLPRISGGQFLGLVMRHHPLPVVMVTRNTPAHIKNEEQLRLLGAVGTVRKPSSESDLGRYRAEIKQIVETILQFQAVTKSETQESAVEETASSQLIAQQSQFIETPIVIAMGASTGGPIAMRSIVRHFCANSPPVLIAQHISGRFSTSLVQGLQRMTQMEVSLATHGTQLAWGHIYVAPADKHLEVDADGRMRLLSAVAADKFAPSVNILFNSLTRSSRMSVIATLLTGMGCDGADGLMRLKQTGASTIAEHRDSCVVYGMPARAVELGAASEILPLSVIGLRIKELVNERLVRIRQGGGKPKAESVKAVAQR